MRKILYIPILCCMVLIYSCKTSKVDVVEPVKDITGKWQVIKVVQNGVDVTRFVNLNDFLLDFNANKYSLTGKLPFLVYESGTWSFNDPDYPFSISFEPGSTGTRATSRLLMPLVDGNYQLIMNFSNSCAGIYEHNYQYTFKLAGK